LNASRVNELTLPPVYTATIVSKSLPAVVIVVAVEKGACHWYQIVRPGLSEVESVGSWLGSPASLVAPKVDPPMLPEHPVMV
jgi:hypothetical protein